MEKQILLDLREKIKNCSICEMEEIFKLLNHLNYTQNKNGIFIDMKQFDDSLVTKINNLLEYFRVNKEKEKTREELINKIKLNSIATI